MTRASSSATIAPWWETPLWEEPVADLLAEGFEVDQPVYGENGGLSHFKVHRLPAPSPAPAAEQVLQADAPVEAVAPAELDAPAEVEAPPEVAALVAAAEEQSLTAKHKNAAWCITCKSVKLSRTHFTVATHHARRKQRVTEAELKEYLDKHRGGGHSRSACQSGASSSAGNALPVVAQSAGVADVELEPYWFEFGMYKKPRGTFG